MASCAVFIVFGKLLVFLLPGPWSPVCCEWVLIGREKLRCLRNPEDVLEGASFRLLLDMMFRGSAGGVENDCFNRLSEGVWFEIEHGVQKIKNKWVL